MIICWYNYFVPCRSCFQAPTENFVCGPQSLQLLCLLRSANCQYAKFLHLEICLLSCFIFHQDPVIRSMSPAVGPISGGTEISIEGTELDTGANIIVWLGPKGRNPCNVNRYTYSCHKTVIVMVVGNEYLQIKWKGHFYPFAGENLPMKCSCVRPTGYKENTQQND